jgi:excisionase family DNA binding protein
MDELSTVETVAARGGVSRRTVLQWLRDGALRGAQLGGTKIGWRVRAADLEAFSEQGMNRPPTPAAAGPRP